MAGGSNGSALERELLAQLGASGPSGAPELARLLGLSQPSFSRLVTRLGDRLLVAGKARARRYAARRQLTDLAERLPIYAINEQARATRIGILHAVSPEQWYVEALDATLDSGFHADLPYFLNELRPAGFLGRLVSEQHPELGASPDVRLWSATDVLRYVTRFGWDLPGDLIVGDAAFRSYIEHAATKAGVSDSDREQRYPELIESALSGTPGSSAGGEQPKFLVSRPDGLVSLLVKFSPPMNEPVGRRSADLLIAEHLVHEVLAELGIAAARSTLFVTGGRTFLEVERFDRTPGGGRRGLLSLEALDAEFVGRAYSWSDSVQRLIQARVLERAVSQPVRWLELFGRLIGNSDMHGGNLSFFAEGMRVRGLAPVYDMLPARYAGQAGNLVDTELVLPAPTPEDAASWDTTSQAALELWRRVAGNAAVSLDFRALATTNAERVAAWRKFGPLLPAPARN